MPPFSKKLKFPKKWNDHEFSPQLMEKLKEIELSLLQSKELHKGFSLLNKGIKGTKVLFIGSSNQEKIYAALYLAKSIDKEVYRIDLSILVSKYIGETEKNLELLFARAEDKDWILFIDEADALLGKRTDVKDAHDRYPNQEVTYLLQRIEDFDGLVILASNFKISYDDAFLKRFDSIIQLHD